MHGHVDASATQLARISMTLEEMGKKALSNRQQQFRWALRTSQGYRTLRLNIFTEPREREEENEEDLIIMTLTVRGSQSASRSLLSDARLKEIQKVLSVMAGEGIAANFDCRIVWHYQADAAEIPIRLPFGLPVPPSSALSTVRGIKVSNEEGDPWLILDLENDPALLHVSVGYSQEFSIREPILDEAIRHGEALVAQVLDFKNGGKQ